MNRFKVAELLSGLRPLEITGDKNATVTDIVYDSRQARPDTVFVAIKGAVADGHDFAPAAAEAGCRVFVVARPVEGLAGAQFVTPDTRRALAKMSARFFGAPSERLSLAGVTGTNGKTTTAYFLDSIYRAAGDKSGLIGTVEYRIGDEARPVSRTTPESYDLQRLLREMTDAGVGMAVMEVSSHAVDQNRVAETVYAVKVFTNVSRDHLDYHRDMESYFAAKRAFMLAGGTPVVVNIDDDRGRLLAPEAADSVTFSRHGPADYFAEESVEKITGSEFTIVSPEGRHEVEIGLPGDFNIMNALASAAAARRQDVSWEHIKSGLANLIAVPGRFERLESTKGFTVVIDYAHTPDSLARAAGAAKRLAGGKVITVFGCGGDRDTGKRPEMGKVACEFSDTVVITSDNPRSEKPEAIIADIVKGAAGDYQVEPDRRKAIRAALSQARAGDIVLIAGKGHESVQEFKDRLEEFDDKLIAVEELKRMAAG